MEALPQTTKSRARKFVPIVACLLTVAGFVIHQLSRPAMPVYQGKPLSKWFKEFQQASESRLVGGSSSSNGLEQCVAAFRHIGSEAVPYLNEQLAKKSSIQEKYVSLKSSSPGWAFKILPSVQFGYWSNRRCAAEALGAIGPAASNAVPALIEAISKTEVYETDKSTGASNGRTFSPQARWAAIKALGNIAPGRRDVVAAFIEALKQKYILVPVLVPSNPSSPYTVADAAANELSGLGSEFKDQIPAMISNLKYQDQREFRGAAISSIYSVGSLAPGYGEHVPKLINALKDPAIETRDAAAYDLGTLRKPDREKAKVALPALAEGLNDPQLLIRIRVSETILAIDASQSKVVLPTLINLLSDTNYLVRLRVIDLLRQIGTDAQVAIPSLTNAIRDNSLTVQTWTKEALEQIDPGATKAGVK